MVNWYSRVTSWRKVTEKKGWDMGEKKSNSSRRGHAARSTIWVMGIPSFLMEIVYQILQELQVLCSFPLSSRPVF